MSETFTPGPWQYTHSDPAEGCDVWWITGIHGSNREKEIATVTGGWPWPSTEANARLIAAAPDLLAALYKAREYIDPTKAVSDTEILTEIDAAISKAEGRT